MIKNKKAKGRRLEYRTRDYLRSIGWFVVRQAASSFPDLIGIKKSYCEKGHSEVGFFECKWNKYLSRGEKVELLEMKEKLGITPFVCFLAKEGRRKVLKIVEVSDKDKTTGGD